MKQEILLDLVIMLAQEVQSLQGGGQKVVKIELKCLACGTQHGFTMETTPVMKMAWPGCKCIELADKRWAAAMEKADWDGGVIHYEGRVYPIPKGFLPDVPATWALKTVQEFKRGILAAAKWLTEHEWDGLAERMVNSLCPTPSEDGPHPLDSLKRPAGGAAPRG